VKRNLSNVLILMALWVVSMLALGVITRIGFEIISLGWDATGEVLKLN
jgi:hypothetical protein